MARHRWLQYLSREQLAYAQFILLFGTCQALYYVMVARHHVLPVHEPGPGKTIVILDGSELTEGKSPSFDEMLRKPAAVLNFDTDGKLTSNQVPPGTPPKKPSSAKKHPSTPPPPSTPKALQPKVQPHPSQQQQQPHQLSESSTADPTPHELKEPPDLAPLQPTPQPQASEPKQPVGVKRQPAHLQATVTPKQQPQVAEAAGGVSSAEDPAPRSRTYIRPGGAPPSCRRPSYIWAQNRTHAFVTLKLDRDERQLSRGFDWQPRVVRARLPAESSEGSASCVALELELYRPIEASGCGSQMTNRGLLLRLVKQKGGHWPRLLRTEGADSRQGIDWSRWEHPDAKRAEVRASREEEFEQRNGARMQAIGRLRPRFDVLLAESTAARERDEAMEPALQKEMLRLGEQILKHYRDEREERETLLGDAPLPAGVDENLLEHTLIKLRELERQGSLDYDRNTKSWKEYRRRQRKRQQARAESEKGGHS
jgi:hypothetical protein